MDVYYRNDSMKSVRGMIVSWIFVKTKGGLESHTKSREKKRKRVRTSGLAFIEKKTAAARAEDGRAGSGWSERCGGDEFSCCEFT